MEFGEQIAEALKKSGAAIDTDGGVPAGTPPASTEGKPKEGEGGDGKPAASGGEGKKEGEGEEGKNQPPVSKSFEEYIAEKSGGKYKSWDEVENIIKTPQEIFADEEIKRLNDLKKLNPNIKFDKDFWDIQSKDYATMSNDDVLIEAMKRSKDYKGWTDKQLQLELDKKYEKKDWSEEGEEPNETKELMTARMLRDSQNAREELMKLKDSLTIVKPQDPKAIEAQKQAAEQAKKAWEDVVEDVSSKTSKLTTVIDEKSKEAFEFDVTDSDRAEAKQIMKELGFDPLALFHQYKTADGKYDNQKVYDAILRFLKAEDRVKLAYQNAKAKGAEEEVKGLKNIAFPKAIDGKSTQPKKEGLAEAVAKSYGYTLKT